MVDAESMDESVEDITAALMAPRPKKATQPGVKYCSERGKTKLVLSPMSLPYSVSFQLVAFAIAPKTTEGPVMISAIRPPPYDNKTALADV